MIIGVLQVELSIGDAQSLKDKRRLLSSLKDRIQRQPSVAVAEVDELDTHQLAVLGIVAVSNSARHAEGMLSRILDQLRNDRRFVLRDEQKEILTGR